MTSLQGKILHDRRDLICHFVGFSSLYVRYNYHSLVYLLALIFTDERDVLPAKCPNRITIKNLKGVLSIAYHPEGANVLTL